MHTGWDSSNASTFPDNTDPDHKSNKLLKNIIRFFESKSRGLINPISKKAILHQLVVRIAWGTSYPEDGVIWNLAIHEILDKLSVAPIVHRAQRMSNSFPVLDRQRLAVKYYRDNMQSSSGLLLSQ